MSCYKNQPMTEQEAHLQFEALVPSSFFKIKKEVPGKFCLAKPIKQLFQTWDKVTEKNVRIDYVLMPTQALLDIGWELGSIGVEVKTGDFTPPYDKRTGKILSQLFDYQSSLFSVDKASLTPLSMIFLYVQPPHRFGGLPASIMMQEGIGIVKGYPHIENSFKLVHGNGNFPIFEITDNTPFYTRPQFGKKIGSR